MINRILLPVAPIDDVANLKSFARGMSVILVVLFCGVLPWLFDRAIPIWPLYPAALLLIVQLIFVKALYPIYVTWMYVASVLGFINTRIILFVAYFGLIAPIGIVMGLLGKLQYSKQPLPKNNSYWIKRNDSPNRERLKEPF